MKKLFLILGALILLGAGRQVLRMQSYHLWLNTHLLGTIWTPTKEKEVLPIINQSFRYCGEGSQSRAYVSEDGQYVLKTFLRERYEDNRFKYIPLIGKLVSHKTTIKKMCKRARGPIYAYQYLPKECGMIYYQFMKPRALFHREIALTEKDGSIRSFNLDQSEFIIQRKAVLSYHYFNDHLAKGDLETVKSAISKLLTMTKMLYDQGVVVATLQFLDNFGFVDGEPMRIDVEHLHIDPKWKQRGKRHFKSQAASLRSWIAERAPQEVIDHIDREIEALNL